MPKKRPVTLPPLPEGWTDRRKVATGARGHLERATVVDHYLPGDEPAKDGLVAVTVPVWRRAMPTAMAHLSRAQRDALMNFAATVEATHATGGQNFAGSGGGSAPGSRPPSLQAMEAARVLDDMRHALAGSVDLCPGDHRRGRVHLEALARWVAVDGCTLRAILSAARVGDYKASRARLKEAITDTADRLLHLESLSL